MPTLCCILSLGDKAKIHRGVALLSGEGLDEIENLSQRGLRVVSARKFLKEERRTRKEEKLTRDIPT